MVKPEDNQLTAAREIASAIRYSVDKDSSVERRKEQQANARIQWGTKVQEAGNLVLASMVLAQVFSEKFNSELALFGLGLFAGAYFFAYGMMRGGGSE